VGGAPDKRPATDDWSTRGTGDRGPPLVLSGFYDYGLREGRSTSQGDGEDVNCRHFDRGERKVSGFRSGM